MFHVAGVLLNIQRAESITWNDGQVTGVPWLVEVVKDSARALDGITLGPPEGPWSTYNHLEDAGGALEIICRMFKPHTIQLSGDIPERPDLAFGEVD